MSISLGRNVPSSGATPSCARARAGFTLIELMIVTVIIGLLAGLAVPRFDEVRTKAFNRTVLSDIRTTIVEIERFSITNYAFPSDLDALFAAGLTLSPGVSFTKFTVTDPGNLTIAQVHAHIEHVGSPNYYHFKYPDDELAELRWK
ncbi:MAG: hypothetical protein BMS9Abin29_1861 [Gemmatimonadota bacterium]|nr:MAG: hypothetical protein BMS9Abin29_1861 [Gemmatimonadota bacterium]